MPYTSAIDRGLPSPLSDSSGSSIRHGRISRNSEEHERTSHEQHRVPKAISKHIIEYFLRNSDALLQDTNIRTMAANARRSTAMKNLIAELRYQTKTGEGRSRHEEARFEEANTFSFDDDLEESIWRFYDGTPTVQPFAEGESRVGKPRPPDVEHLESEHDDVEQPPAAHNRNIPLMDEFSSVSDESDDHDYLAAPRWKRRRNVRVTDAVLLEEQYHLCQEQRQFFLEMTQTMHEMRSFIKTVKDEWLNRARRCNKIAEADAPTLAGDNNLEESAVSYTL
ncbi:hypothetical protein ANCCAN_17335 [Ancylostoma caninum]|uniref:Uncharacterized protein n=1 Tax=Ancylostoma caninum TaxID=29170 RepID=A0A368G2F8_ANCCA|nr:hypothetical protein ANCCAN_17335 [Ancylostoma caninum]